MRKTFRQYLKEEGFVEAIQPVSKVHAPQMRKHRIYFSDLLKKKNGKKETPEEEEKKKEGLIDVKA